MSCSTLSKQEVQDVAKFILKLNSMPDKRSVEVGVRFLGDDKFMLYAWSGGADAPSAVIFNETLSTPTCDAQGIIDQLRRLQFWPNWLYPAESFR